MDTRSRRLWGMWGAQKQDWQRFVKEIYMWINRTSALETCLQPPEYLCALLGGPLHVELPYGIWLIPFFFLHSQSWNGCHWTNNPGFRLNRRVEFKPSPGRCYLYLHKASWSQISTCWAPSWFLSTVWDGCRLHRDAWVKAKQPHPEFELGYYKAGSSLRCKVELMHK